MNEMPDLRKGLIDYSVEHTRIALALATALFAVLGFGADKLHLSQWVQASVFISALLMAASGAVGMHIAMHLAISDPIPDRATAERFVFGWELVAGREFLQLKLPTWRYLQNAPLGVAVVFLLAAGAMAVFVPNTN